MTVVTTNAISDGFFDALKHCDMVYQEGKSSLEGLPF